MTYAFHFLKSQVPPSCWFCRFCRVFSSSSSTCLTWIMGCIMCAGRVYVNLHISSLSLSLSLSPLHALINHFSHTGRFFAQIFYYLTETTGKTSASTSRKEPKSGEIKKAFFYLIKIFVTAVSSVSKKRVHFQEYFWDFKFIGQNLC